MIISNFFHFMQNLLELHKTVVLFFFIFLSKNKIFFVDNVNNFVHNLIFCIFSAFEMSYKGTDFLVYGIGKEWCLNHPDMDKMSKKELLRLLMDDGALVIQAHPYREAGYIDHIRLFPR